MKVPEPLFLIINPVMKFILRSPLHGIFSGSIMLITFTGRKSGRQFTTPVRYTRHGENIRCYTITENKWWRNLVDGAEVTLRVAGRERRYSATAIVDDYPLVRERLAEYLGIYPQDAAYHEVKVAADGSLVAEDLDRAAGHAVVVEAKPI